MQGITVFVRQKGLYHLGRYAPERCRDHPQAATRMENLRRPVSKLFAQLGQALPIRAQALHDATEGQHSRRNAPDTLELAMELCSTPSTRPARPLVALQSLMCCGHAVEVSFPYTALLFRQEFEGSLLSRQLISGPLG